MSKDKRDRKDKRVLTRVEQAGQPLLGLAAFFGLLNNPLAILEIVIKYSFCIGILSLHSLFMSFISEIFSIVLKQKSLLKTVVVINIFVETIIYFSQYSLKNRKFKTL